MIKKDNIIIRTVHSDDLKIIYEWNNQNARGSFQEFHFESYVNIKKEFEETGFNTDNHKMFIIEITNQKQIGLVYINFIRDGLVRIGLVISKEKYRKKGYGTKVTKIITNHIFENYPIERIEADTDNENIGAQKVLKEAGFKKEGVLRNYRYHHRKWRDSVIYSILKNEILT